MKTDILEFDINKLFAFLLTCTRNFDTNNVLSAGKDECVKFAANELKRLGNFSDLSETAKEKATYSLTLYLLGNENNAFSNLVKQHSVFAQ